MNKLNRTREEHVYCTITENYINSLNAVPNLGTNLSNQTELISDAILLMLSVITLESKNHIGYNPCVCLCVFCLMALELSQLAKTSVSILLRKCFSYQIYICMFKICKSSEQIMLFIQLYITHNILNFYIIIFLLFYNIAQFITY